MRLCAKPNLHLSTLAVCIATLLAACEQDDSLFQQVSKSRSGITFTNRIIENDSLNPLDVVNIYNGGGVGIGDFNNDGLQDIYFTGNMVPGELYLNRGGLRFRNVTDKAGVGGEGRWGRGVAVVDINHDGLMDLYISNTIYKDSLRRRNLLYINQGIGKDGVPRFTDQAAAYGLDIHLQSTMASFFDYDNDGDLDMYLAVNEASNGSSTSTFFARNQTTQAPSRGRLYRNEESPAAKHPVYRDVSEEAGIMRQGYGHAATICDINADGWKDIYVSDDFLSDNILYINNGNGTFTDRAKDYFKHTSFNAMGQDVVDINNDGLADVVELDMSPEDNYRKKMMQNANNYVSVQNFTNYGYQYQYVRNTLQLNQGPRMLADDSVGAPAFSEIGFLSGIAETDWSWTPVVTDFDNDGLRDIIVTNGFPKDVSDHDFVAYRDRSSGKEAVSSLMEKIPVIRLKNYAFRNAGGARFNDVSKAWGLTTKNFSNGAAYADLDNDGDMDLVISNINDKASVYENTLRQSAADTSNNYLQLQFDGGGKNRQGLGAFAQIYYDGQTQVYEHNPYRGYLSTNQGIAHFGLGKREKIDSLVIRWPDGRRQTLPNVSANQRITVRSKDANEKNLPPTAVPAGLFADITKAAGIDYRHLDIDFVDFNIQTTLPHKLSEYSPALAAGDLNGDGLDDLLAGGNFNNRATLFQQQQDGTFLTKRFLDNSDSSGIFYKDEGVLLFDANGDGRLDVYMSSGGYQWEANSRNYQDRLYINQGGGKFSWVPEALPANHTSKLCVRSMDYNKDGKPDIFVSGRVFPWQYPKPVSSFIFRNDTENGSVKFTDVTAEVAPALQNIGMVCDALFTDFDNDNQTDLILVGEWMPVTFLKNTNGKFSNVTQSTGIDGQTGWWTSIAAGDFRHTGRMDYIVGNLGMNSLYKASAKYPVYITAKDFDNNGGFEAIPSLFLPSEDGTLKEYPSHGRDDVLEKLPALKKRFNDYRSFATATMDTLFTAEQRKGALRLQVTNLQSGYLRNEGNGRFTLIPLPESAQLAPLNGMVTDDFDGDGHLDVLINGNDYSTEVSIGRYDALNGLLLSGDGRGGFRPLSIQQSGVYIPGDGKALVRFGSASGDYLVAASQHKGPLKLMRLSQRPRMLRFTTGDAYALITYADGSVEKRESYLGHSFLSQSSSSSILSPQVVAVTIYDRAHRGRAVALDDE